jgi:hypothetical protein
MPIGRLMAAIAALALVAASAVAQVTDATAANKPAVTADQPSAPAPPASTLPVKVSPVPEPGSIALISGSVAAVGWVTYWRRKWRAAPNPETPTTQI